MKNLKLVELCSGIGAQAKGLEHTGLFQVESVATADLDKEVVVSYAAIHCGLTNELIESYENYPSKEEMAAELTAKRLGYDFKNDKPYDWYKLSRKKDKTKGIEKYWLADHLSHNLGDMMKVEALPDCDFLTYSTPCQSLSIAGHQDGLKWTCQDCGHEYDPASLSVEERYVCPVCGSEHVKSTRSGLLYEVERLLVTAKQNGNLPKYLLMENVDALVSKKYIDSFNNWLERLDNLGYNSYYQVINAKNAGVPQNRKRIFVFSILKEIDTGKFTFPVPFDNGIRLKDVLENTVEERYYLSDEKVASFLGNLIKTEDEDTVSVKQATKEGYIKCELPGVADLSYPESTTRRGRVQENGTVSPTLTAAQTGICKLEKTNEVLQIGNIAEGKSGWDNPQTGRIYSIEGCSPTLNTCNGGGHEPKIVTTTRGSEIASCVRASYFKNGNRNIEENIKSGKGYEGIIEKYGCDKSNNSPQIIERANCITAREDRGISNHKSEGTAVIEKIGNINPSGKGINGNVFGENGLAPTLTTNKGEGPKIAISSDTSYITPYIRIRKLTPKECHRLMGFDDIDVDRCKAVGMSDAQGYHQAGNSIVTNVISLIAEHLYKAQYDETYECLDEKMTNFQKPQME